MNILLISQCSKNALIETRRIIDQFAERRGERTWQTPITQAGLDTLYRLLRKTARKNTAVACHWIRGKDHSELLWVVGDARQFNAQGAVPTNATRRNILRSHDENDWHSGEDIRLLARLAALFHDLGKANQAFQDKLASGLPVADPFRHEWVSLRLFEAFVGKDCTSDRAWLQRLIDLDGSESAQVLTALLKDGQSSPQGPFATLKLPLARMIGWLIVSHHRLPTPVIDSDKDRLLKPQGLNTLPGGIVHGWCGSRLDDTDAKLQAACWRFKALPFDSRHWREHVGKTAAAILKRPTLLDAGAEASLASPYVMHLARLALMLADHYYSSQASHARYGDPLRRGSKPLYANTLREKGAPPRLNQRLDEHLIGVGVNASRLMHSLPRMERSLPRIARHKGFRGRSAGAFRWQNTAFDLAESLRDKAAEHGFFGVNLASTGCGKTFANARILYGLADPQLGARFTVALGLRSLTLQTGDAYRERLHLGPEDLAVLVGGAASRALHEHYKARARDFAANGSESARDLLPEYNHVRYEGSLEDGPLKRWLQQGKQGLQAGSLLNAPVLVCTVDHLMPACESTRGGHQILPMLRLMSSDLVLDEPDDFDVADLPALTRLVHWAGMLGSRVLLSSATLPPALVQGLYLAYCAGRREFQRHRGRPGIGSDVCCAWFDEFGASTSSHGDDPEGTGFLDSHAAFVSKRIARLAATKEVRRRGAILDLPAIPTKALDPAGRQAEIAQQLAILLRDEALALHRQHHDSDAATGKRVSFGLIRMANIDPLFDVARSLFALGAPAGYQIHLCVYHARHPMLVRAEIERELDVTLKRHRPEAVFNLAGIRDRLDSSTATDHLFIVLATAVAEVGRDHCYDWAIVEPSSMRSIIQLAGRVKRHRPFDCPPEHANILLLGSNVKSLKQDGAGPAFCQPGFESRDFPLKTHALRELLTPEQWQAIDARSRIQARATLDASGSLVDLEHARLADLMLGASDAAQRQLPVHWWWTTHAHLSGALQNRSRFRADPKGHQTFFLKPDEDGDSTEFIWLEPTGKELPVESNLLQRIADADLRTGSGIDCWAAPDYLSALQTLAENLGMEPLDCARRFGTVDLPGREPERWRYHPALGFSRAG
ncbi:MAG: type I-F CRISPR-associated helicase Cas3 [Proteobacteria bacterium]|nr:type I-F CRISPR-associated helicase Cas3 [Pseudomonadota bacterium]